MRGLMVALLALGAGIGCVEIPATRTAAADLPVTVYSPGDGLLMVFVTTASTATVTASLVGSPSTPQGTLPIRLALEDADLGGVLVAHLKQGALLLEPGRYVVTDVQLGRLRAALRSEPFTVRSGRRTVLPDLVVRGEAPWLEIGFAEGSRFDEAMFEASFPGTPWVGRPRLGVDWSVRTKASLVPWSSGWRGGSRPFSGDTRSTRSTSSGTTRSSPPPVRSPR